MLNNNQNSNNHCYIAAFIGCVIVALSLFLPVDALAATNVKNLTIQVANETRFIPRFINIICYCIGVFLVANSLFKLRAHVEAPTQAPLKEGLIKLAVGTFLLALPFTMSMVLETMTGINAGIAAGASIDEVTPDADGRVITTGASAASGRSLGWMTLNIIRNGVIHWPIFIAWISYLIGIVFVVQCALKLKQHAEQPTQMPLSEPIKFFVAGGLMLSLPTVMNIIINTLGFNGAFGIAASTNPLVAGGSGGLDDMMINFIQDLFKPMDVIITVFCLIAGIIFAFMGLHRLTKSEREGARGPLGFGTIMLFLISGILMSMGSTIGTVTQTFFGTTAVTNNVAILGFSGVSAANLAHATNVLAAIIQFMMVVGLISFVRGWFILKAAADGGSQQATIMSSVVHIIAGILLINLGPFLTAVQKTLGISPSTGLSFS